MRIEKIYINKRNKLGYRDRLRIIKQYQYYYGKPTLLAKQYGVSRQTIYDIINRYKRDGLHGIEDHKPGKHEESLNPNFYNYVIQVRNMHDWGAIRTKAYTQKKGFLVSSY